MTRQLVTEFKHPLYPNPDLLKYHNDHKILYHPYQGSYDDSYNNWYQLVRADHDISGAPIRPIYREISQIIRLKSSGHEYLLYGETLYGQDHENNQIPFFHTYGAYIKPSFKTVYNYETKQASTIRSGQVETVFFIPLSKDLLNDELYLAGPDDKDIELLVNVGSRQYGGRGFYTYEEFKDSSLEDLARIGREGKGMYSTLSAKVPTGTMIAELRNANNTTTTATTTSTNTTSAQQESQLYKEFMEFKKWKQQNPPPPSPSPPTTTIEQTTTTTTVKEKDSKK